MTETKTLCIPIKNAAKDKHFVPGYNVLPLDFLDKTDPKSVKQLQEQIDKMVELEGTQYEEVKKEIEKLPYLTQKLIGLEVEKSVQRSEMSSQRQDEMDFLEPFVNLSRSSSVINGVPIDKGCMYNQDFRYDYVKEDNRMLIEYEKVEL